MSLTAGPPPAEPSYIRNVHRMVFLGDSIIASGGLPKGFVTLVGSYLRTLYPSHNFQLINAGVMGETSSQMLSRFERDVLASKPDVLFLMAGLNDIRLNVDASEYARAVETMVENAEAAGIKVVILSPPITSEYQDIKTPLAQQCNEVLKAIAQKHNQDYIDISPSLNALIRDYRQMTGARDYLVTMDGDHLSAAGNRVVANLILWQLGISPDLRGRVRSQNEAYDI